MKLTVVIFTSIVLFNVNHAINPLKVPDSIKGKVFSAAGKFLSGKSNKIPASTNTASITNPTGKTSRMGQLMDIGTNAAMAIAGAGTLFQALSSDKNTPTPSTSVSIFFIYDNHHFLFKLNVF